MLNKFISHTGFLRSKKSADQPQALGSRAEAWIVDGRRAETDGRLEEACASYRRAIAAEPDYPASYLNLGIALSTLGRIGEARQVYETALALDPGNAFVLYNLGHLAFCDEDYPEAERWVRVATERKYDFPEAHVLLAEILEAQGQEEAGLDELAVAIQLRENYLGAHFNFALLALKLRRYEDAEDAIRRFLEGEPGHLGAMQILSSALWGQGLCAESLECLGFIRDKVPDVIEIESRILFLLNVDPGVTAEDLFQKHLEFGALIERSVPQRFQFLSRNMDRARRLRIGYVSGDYSWHPVAMFLIPVIERHNRQDFEIYCYSTGTKSDEITQQIIPMPDHWVDGASMSDKELADKIYEDEIDILVDLGGLTASSRLTIYAQQPAPVQVSWMGYLNTTGLSRMHYRICDARTDPLGSADRLHTEKLVRLPYSQWCYRPFIKVAAKDQAPWESNGFITFGSYNHVLKISPELCATWAEILHQVPNSRLLCVGLSSTRKMSELLSELTLTGVDAGRIQFIARVNLDQYYAWFSEADIALDTFPYGGGTTTFDALWMGTPVVAAKGSTPTSRSAASILEALGMDEWVAPTMDDYVRVAVERANEPERITELRRSLRPALQSSPLMDEERFTKDLEGAYRLMWREWCEKADHCRIPPA